jgi:hypothetical protein
MIDARCTACSKERLDFLLRDDNIIAPCADCGQPLERIFLESGHGTATVHQDSYEGGIYIKHGLCHPDGTPKRYDSRSEIRRAEKERGYTNVVEHSPHPTTGSDKSKHTSRWV